MTDINHYTPVEILNKLATIFEGARERRDLTELKQGLSLSEKVDLTKFNNRDKCVYNYFVANGWSYVSLIKHGDPNIIEPSSVEKEKEIYHLRVALSYIDYTDHENACQILTNLGRVFSDVGRYADALHYFNWALKINPDFGMAIGNKGYSLFCHAKELFEASHQFIFLQYARKYLIEACDKENVYPDVRQGFGDLAKHIATSYPTESLDDYKIYPDILADCKTEEKLYRHWCIDNVLFLNPLNDVLCQSIVAQDVIHTPTMTLTREERPIYQSIYNQMKQEFVTARFLFYEGAYEDKMHFSDHDVKLYSVMDMPLYSINVEKVKISFRICYSIFDKIAYLLNIYLKLGIDKNKVSFRNIWHQKGNRRNPLNPEIFRRKNWALQGLFWLSKDIDEGADSPIEPEAREVAIIRNYLEHKSFKVVIAKNPCWGEAPETYEIEQDYFYDKTLSLLKLTRSALLYLSSALYEEESRREPLDGPVKTIEMPLINSY